MQQTELGFLALKPEENVIEQLKKLILENSEKCCKTEFFKNIFLNQKNRAYHLHGETRSSTVSQFKL